MKQKPAGPNPETTPAEPASAAAPAVPPRRSSAPFLLGLAGGLVLSLLLALPLTLRSLTGRFGFEGPPLIPPVFPGPAALLPLLLIAAGVWLILWAVPHFRGPDPALQLLRERYARGEISEADYQRMAETLTRAR
ncbi:MAG TPA: SHOCT domain-containing protein [Candidatus Acidoferrales bacterium]|nr:SHOCT domain-containing protein [Candidatus Acidoferrales bacterium]